MLVPILKEGDYLIASIPSPLNDTELLQLRDALVERVDRAEAQGVLVDVSRVDVMDSFAVRTLSSLATMTTLRGAETVVVGIQPEVASAMAQLGLSLQGIETALDIPDGAAWLDERARRSIHAGD
ncbi:MAG TPA: STAS domain-containing protein [Gemmatimonadaceae bacterium]|nr:STAS domain-containing protein [Gemmatimonadaceae bacterium]